MKVDELKMAIGYIGLAVLLLGLVLVGHALFREGSIVLAAIVLIAGLVMSAAGTTESQNRSRGPGRALSCLGTLILGLSGVACVWVVALGSMMSTPIVGGGPQHHQQARSRAGEFRTSGLTKVAVGAVTGAAVLFLGGFLSGRKEEGDAD